VDHPAAHAAAMRLLAAVAESSLTPAGVLRLPCLEREPALAATWLAELLPGAP